MKFFQSQCEYITILFFSCMSSLCFFNFCVSDNQKVTVNTLLESHKYINKNVSIIGEQEWQDFDVNTILGVLDRTLTAFGPWGLRQLVNPVQNIREIKRRQALIKTLATDGYLRFKLIALLKEIQNVERDIIAYWDEHDALHVGCQGLYYSIAGSYTSKLDNYLNGSRMALENSALLDIGKNIAALGSLLGTTGLLNEAVNSAITKRPFSVRRGLVDGLMQPIRVHTLKPNVYANGYQENKWADVFTAGTAGDYYINVRDGWHWPRPIAVVATAGYIFGNDVMFALNVRDALRRVREIHTMHNLLQLRMTHVATLFKAIEKLHYFITMHIPMFAADELAALGTFCDSTHKSKPLSDLYELLKTATFHEQVEYFYSRGRVLLANKTLNDNKDSLIPVLQVIGLIDAYCSIATLVDEYKYNGTRFCCAEFVEYEKPFIACDDFWTPLMPAQQAVLNSVEWGNGSATSNIILTGPNGGGKSTIMKALGVSIILSQSWGIAPAKSIRLTPFSGVRTSFIQRENLQENMSTFMAEKARIDSIRSFIQDYKVGDRYFVLLDEPYRGTIETEAARLICMLGKELVLFPHAMLIVATHLEKPISLERETGVFANYHLVITESDGRFVFTYKLVQGPADWWFKDVDRRARFVDQLLANKANC